MAVYARSDVMGIAIPMESGGCGQNHTRPVIQGAPAEIWKLSCPQCETYIKDDIDRSTYKVTDRDGKTTVINNSVWGEHPTKTPLTPDEQRIASDLQKEGETGVAKLMEGMASAAWAQQNQNRLSAVEQAERASAELAASARVEQLERELREMREFLRDAAQKTPVVVEARLKPEPKSAAPKQAKAPQSISAPRKAPVCASCGGPLRAPGAKGPTPKGTCMSCRRAKARVA
jgi:hypothetical protein